MSDNDTVKIGTVNNCGRLNVRVAPCISADVVCEVARGCEVMIDEKESTEEFYKVYTPAGIEGFCVREYIQV